MDAVVLALASAALFGSMTVALRFALARVPDAELGALHTIAVALLDEPAKAGVVTGGLLIVVGGILPAREPGRPEHVKWVGLGFALVATIVFAVRDNLVRHLSLDTEVEPALAAACTLLAGGLTVAVWLLATRRRLPVRGLLTFVPAGICFGLSYLCLFEAYYRGRVSVVSP